MPRHLTPSSPLWDTVIYDASLVFDETSWELIRLKTTGDFYLEEYRPCWYRSSDALWFKNLDYVSVFTTAVSGVLDISSYIAGDPPTIDSPFWVVDQSGRALRYDTLSPAVSGSRITLGVGGTFQVWYRSQARYTQLCNGDVFARFDEQIIPLTQTPLDNPWTHHLSLVSPLIRGLRFTNLEVRKNLQAWSLAWNEEFRIGALLGLITLDSWDSTTVYNASGYSSIQIPNTRPFEYRTEQPFLTTEGLRVTRQLHEPVEVWWSNQLLDASTYTISNTGVVLQTDYLSTAQRQSLKVKYRTITYEATGSTVVAESLDHRNHYLLKTAGINIDTGTLKIEWIWDRSPENTEGGGVFT